MLHSLLIAPLLAFVLGALQAYPAAAKDQPELRPTRPVVVTYELSGGQQTNGAGKVRVSFSADADRVRMDWFRSAESRDPFGSLIFDKLHNRVITLLPERKAYLERDTAGLVNPALLLSPDLHYTRKGSEQFAGLSCTDWEVRNEDQPDSAGTVCVTDDGVALKAERGPSHTGTMRAIAIEYTTPPESAFEIPAGYTRMKTRPHRS